MHSESRCALCVSVYSAGERSSCFLRNWGNNWGNFMETFLSFFQQFQNLLDSLAAGRDGGVNLFLILFGFTSQSDVHFSHEIE